MVENRIFNFLRWRNQKKYFLVSGASWEKVKEQLSQSILASSEGIFTSMGNELRVKEKIIYQHFWKPSTALLTELLDQRENSSYPYKGKKYLEQRCGMINFCIIGRDANLQKRKKYYEWDILSKEREGIAAAIMNKFPHLEACLGGQTSIDIQRKGYNKSQASQWIRKNRKGHIVFFGDKCYLGGNDYDVCEDIKKHKDGEVYEVKDDNETFKILNSYERQEETSVRPPKPIS